MIPLEFFDEAEECIVPQQAARNSALTIICHKNGGKRLRISKKIMNDVLKDVTAVGVRTKFPYIIISEQAGGIPVRREGKDHDGAGLVYNGALVDDVVNKLSLDFNGQSSLHFYEWDHAETEDGRKAVGFKVE